MSSPEGLRIERPRLVFMGLVALDEVAEHCLRHAYPRNFTLRVTLATLYAFSDGTRKPYDSFWRECGAPDTAADPRQAATVRANAVRGSYHWICRTLGIKETIDFCSDVNAARRDPGPHMRHYDALRRSLQNDDAAARQRFAEMLRTGVRERNEAREQGRRMRECKLGG